MASRATRWSVVVALGVGLGAMGPGAVRGDDATTGGDLKKMQGVWVHANDETPESRWTIEGETLKAEVNGLEYACALTLDPKASPHASIDFAVKEGPGAGKAALGIYKFEGDRLIVCVAKPGEATRPAAFKTVEDEAYLFELKPGK